jgi:hypothetical protein
MSIQSIKLWLLFAVALSCAGCGDDPFSQVSTVNIPEHERLPAISLHLVAGDSVLRPGLDLSRGIVDNSFSDQRLGTLQLFKNGTESFNFSGISVGGALPEDLVFRAEQADAFLGEEGDQYELTATIEGLATATATQRMPGAPVVTEVEFIPEGGIDTDGDPLDEITFTLSDPGGVKNYYAFQVASLDTLAANCEVVGDTVSCDTVVLRSIFFSSSPDPLLVENARIGLTITDESFDGSTYRGRLQFSANFSGNEQYALRVYALTEDGFRYLRSYTAYEDSRFDPFSEPVNVHNNVLNGYGIFMVSNLTEVRAE